MPLLRLEAVDGEPAKLFIRAYFPTAGSKMYPEPTKDAQTESDAAKIAVVKVRCLACAKAGAGGEFPVPHYERQSPRVPEIEGLNLETRKSGGPFHQCTRHKPPVVLLRWLVLRNRPPVVRGSP